MLGPKWRGSFSITSTHHLPGLPGHSGARPPWKNPVSENIIASVGEGHGEEDREKKPKSKKLTCIGKPQNDNSGLLILGLRVEVLSRHQVACRVFGLVERAVGSGFCAWTWRPAWWILIFQRCPKGGANLFPGSPQMDCCKISQEPTWGKAWFPAVGSRAGESGSEPSGLHLLIL